jgi:hypothetical protein
VSSNDRQLLSGALGAGPGRVGQPRLNASVGKHGGKTNREHGEAYEGQCKPEAQPETGKQSHSFANR